MPQTSTDTAIQVTIQAKLYNVEAAIMHTFLIVKTRSQKIVLLQTSEKFYQGSGI